jgi:type VI secretion system secreted protein VgrG
MEVVVASINGEPGRPIVIGCIYNGDNPRPYTLPGKIDVPFVERSLHLDRIDEQHWGRKDYGR